MRFAILCTALIAATGCATGPQTYSAADFGALRKIDVHVHINSSDPALIDQAAADGFRLLTINTDDPDYPALSRQRALAMEHVQAHPDRVAYAASFTMPGWDEAGWQDRVLRDLDAAFAEGAVAIKVWKNIGMEFRDQAGQLVMIDDPKFDAIFEHVREHNKVLIGHQGEPYNCWLPLAQMTVSGDREYFRDRPRYYMYLHPELPSYEEQMAARNRMLDKHRDLRFMGAHLASLEWSVSRLAEFLDRYPLAVVDMAARMGQLQYQSNRDRAAVRAFFIRYQDRVIYGTDLTQDADSAAADIRKEAHERWLSDWNYLATDQIHPVVDLEVPARGLGLPRSVIDKIYQRNAERWFPDAWRPSAAREGT